MSKIFRTILKFKHTSVHVFARALLPFARSNLIASWRLLRREGHPPRNDIVNFRNGDC